MASRTTTVYSTTGRPTQTKTHQTYNYTGLVNVIKIYCAELNTNNHLQNHINTYDLRILDICIGSVICSHRNEPGQMTCWKNLLCCILWGVHMPVFCTTKS